jgi:LysM repeat protein
MNKQKMTSALAAGFAALVFSTQVSCKSGAAGVASADGATQDYPFDSNGNYRPEFLAANGGQEVVDLTKDNPRSEFLQTASNDGWKVSSSASSSGSRSGASSTKATSRPKPTVRPKPVSKPVVKAKPKPAPVSSVSHKVVAGDTLYSLAKRYGASVPAIQSANGLGGSTNLKLGSSLRIPRK